MVKYVFRFSTVGITPLVLRNHLHHLLMTKLYLSDLKTQSVPCSKHCLGYKNR